MKKIVALLCLVPAMVALPLAAQTDSPTVWRQDEMIAYIGMKIDDLYRRLGPPKSVYTARGDEDWQDDVVFVYDEGDFYIFQNRVWQLGLRAFHGMKLGDPKAVAILVLKEGARDRGDYVSYNIPGTTWPLSIRVNFDGGKISAIYIFRPDY